MYKNLKDKITEILDKSGLVDIHLAQGLIVQPIIDHIESNLPKEEDTKYETKDEGFKECLERVKKGLGI